MIAFLRGRLAAAGAGRAVLDVNGVGYLLQVPTSTLARLPAPGSAGADDLCLQTVLVVREDALTLFGFATLEERGLFEMMISVSGVGPKLALAALSALGAAGLVDALARGDARALGRVPGVGPRTAERLLLELRDRVGALLAPAALAAGGAAAGLPPDAAAGGFGAAGASGSAEAEAAAALEALGCTAAEAARAVAEAAAALPPDATAEALVRGALRHLASGPRPRGDRR